MSTDASRRAHNGESVPRRSLGAFDNVNHLAALSLGVDAFCRYRDYREWLIADGEGAQRIVALLELYVWDLCECPAPRCMH